MTDVGLNIAIKGLADVPGVQLVEKMRSSLRMGISDTVFHIDLTTTLSWLNKPTNHLKALIVSRNYKSVRNDRTKSGAMCHQLLIIRI
ncbi:hypothetical protein TNCV_3340001 [Trichonephila clavipes]|nr:hypothetical protein TNCV_3340001 [Trichonephila clavipes]